MALEKEDKANKESAPSWERLPSSGMALASKAFQLATWLWLRAWAIVTHGVAAAYIIGILTILTSVLTTIWVIQVTTSNGGFSDRSSDETPILFEGVTDLEANPAPSTSEAISATDPVAGLLEQHEDSDQQTESLVNDSLSENQENFQDANVRNLQEALASRGYYAGLIDGVVGSQTIQATRTAAEAVDVAAPDLATPSQNEIERFISLIASTETVAQPDIGSTESGINEPEIASAEPAEPGEIFKDCELCPEMVMLPPGAFMLGSPIGESEDRDDEDDRSWSGGNQVEIQIAHGFAISQHEVTWSQWQACVDAQICGQISPNAASSDEGWGRGERPVINVSWLDARSFTTWLTSVTGEAYRLPSEAEWEYAARANSVTAYPPEFGGERIGVTTANFDRHIGATQIVGSYRSNSFGLYDMHGNVWEWVEDCYQGSYAGLPTSGSPLEYANCQNRVIRGGSWREPPESLRSANRGYADFTTRDSDIGFRVVRE